jgi:gas vesicle protein
MNLTGILIGAVLGATIGFIIALLGRRGQKN